jgi:hypothetical protein
MIDITRKSFFIICQPNRIHSHKYNQTSGIISFGGNLQEFIEIVRGPWDCLVWEGWKGRREPPTGAELSLRFLLHKL